MSCFRGRYKVTSPYGYRTRKGKREFHQGIDLVGLSDTTVYAPCDGVIGSSTRVYVGTTAGWGNYVRIDTSDGKYSIFLCHLKTRYAVKGQSVRKGDRIGVMGNTGDSDGAHTHFEVRYKGSSTHINPCTVFSIPAEKGTYDSDDIKKELESGNDIVWQLMNGKLGVEINEPERAVKALDKAKDDSEFMSLYWIIRKVVNEHGF